MKGQIQIKTSKWAPECTVESNLTENQMKAPAIRDFIEMSNPRMLSTLLASGSASKYGMGFVPTRISDVVDSSGKLIGNNAYQFDVWTRLQIPSTIVAQIGTSSSNGAFSISTKENLWYPGLNVLFHGQGFQARVMSAAQGGPGNYIWQLESPDGTVFDWNTHVAPQQGVKTAFAGYSSYGEKSMRGYGRSFFPNTFIQHMTIQRKSIGISGGANSDVTWYEWVNPQTNAPVKGWKYEQERQLEEQFMMEDEFQKWEGISNMKSATGTLLAAPRQTDAETGLPITQGDGVMQQIFGGNEFSGSGTDGGQTIADITDMGTSIRKKSNKMGGLVIIIKTGEDGFNRLQRILPAHAANNNIRQVQIVNQSSAPGGAGVDIGFNYQNFNINGDQYVVVKDPMQDDDERWTRKRSRW